MNYSVELGDSDGFDFGMNESPTRPPLIPVQAKVAWSGRRALRRSLLLLRTPSRVQLMKVAHLRMHLNRACRAVSGDVITGTPRVLT